MSVEFYGTREITVDGAGRVKLPSAFRREFEINGFGPDVVVAYRELNGQGFMMLYPRGVWKRILEHVSEVPDLSALDVEAMRRRLNRWSEMASMDKQGRIMLPKRFTEKAGLAAGSEAALVGSGNRIEVWQLALCDKTVDETALDDEKIAAVLNYK